MILGNKDIREVELTTVRAVTVPIRRGKKLSIRYADFEKAVNLAKEGGGKLLFLFPGDSHPTDMGVMVQPSSVVPTSPEAEASAGPEDDTEDGEPEKAEKREGDAKPGPDNAGPTQTE